MITSRQLANEIIVASDQSKIVDRKLASTVVFFLQQKNLLALLPNILKRIEEKLAQRMAGEKLYITTAFPISDTMVEKIRSVVDASEALVEVSIEEGVIGGFIARYKGKTYDASVTKVTGELAGTLSS